MTTLQEVATLEMQRAVRSDRWFSLLRVAPAGWAALDADLAAIEAVVRAHVRRTDPVVRVREREIAVLLIEAPGEGVHVPLDRVREALAAQVPELDVRVGWASVGPGHRPTWQDGWRWAGQLLVAGAAVPAAA